MVCNAECRKLWDNKRRRINQFKKMVLPVVCECGQINCVSCKKCDELKAFVSKEIKRAIDRQNNRGQKGWDYAVRLRLAANKYRTSKQHRKDVFGGDVWSAINNIRQRTNRFNRDLNDPWGKATRTKLGNLRKRIRRNATRNERTNSVGGRDHRTVSTEQIQMCFDWMGTTAG